MVTRLDLEYDGAAFAGWARQPGKRTVQAEVERVLAQLLTGRGLAPQLVVAGRTDAGVHATGQVCSYHGPPVGVRNLNSLLPRDVAVTAVTRAPEGFDARFDAVARAYRYRVLTRAARSPFLERRALHHPQPLDRAALDACAAALPGTHDLTAFTPTDTRHRLFVRTIDRAAWEDEADGLIAFAIEARSFMRSMNRVLVGTMLEVGLGKRTVDDFVALLEGAPREAAGTTAVPDGLTLVRVRYPEELRFEPVG